FHEGTQETTTYGYDAQGRLTREDSPDGVTTWAWDSAANGIGQLASAESHDGVKTAYRYDPMGRTIGVDQAFGGHVVSLTNVYDAQGRLDQVLLPSLSGNPAPGLTLKYHYNASESLSGIDFATPGSLFQSLWTVQKRNADGALLQGKLGNGVTVKR